MLKMLLLQRSSSRENGNPVLRDGQQLGFRLKDSERGLKLAFLINAAMFAVFNLSIMNYVGAVGSLSVIVITAVSLLRNKPAQNV